jgi:hypothetical protein
VKLHELLRLSEDVLTHRKLWLLAIGLCRTVQHKLHTSLTPWLDIFEVHADGSSPNMRRDVPEKTLREIADMLSTTTVGQYRVNSLVNALFAGPAVTSTGWVHGMRTDHITAYCNAVGAVTRSGGLTSEGVQSAQQCQHDLMLELFTDVVDPTVIPVRVYHYKSRRCEIAAMDIYENHRFEDMPILGDLLEDAGLRRPEHQMALAHCRDRSAFHVRGCWVLDALLTHVQRRKREFRRLPGERAAN